MLQHIWAVQVIPFAIPPKYRHNVVKKPRLWGYLGGPAGSPAACRRIRTLYLFSGMDKMLGVMEENSRLLRQVSPKITIQRAALLAACFSISVPELYPKGTTV